MARFNIYRLNDDGTGSWAATAYDAATAEEALAVSQGRCVPEGGTFVVVDPFVNPNNRETGFTDGQIVFTLERPPAPEPIVVPVGLAHGLF